MATTVDIVFCMDYTTSITSYFSKACRMIESTGEMFLQDGRDVRMSLVKFRSADDLWQHNVHGFTQDVATLLQWLLSNTPDGVGSDHNKAVGNALYEAANVGWRANNNNQTFNEKLVVLITDGAPNGLFTSLIGQDPWVISNRFMEQDITLVVVGVEESVVVCDDFYCALAKNTGGAYIPMVNVERIFRNVIYSVMNTGDTFRQAFRHVAMEDIAENSSFKYSDMKDRVDRMIKECETMNDIRRFLKRRGFGF